jgi:hypothetical protein
MSSIQCSKRLSILGLLLVVASCAHVEKSSSRPDNQTVVVNPAGSCQGADGPVADGTIVYRCAMPNKGLTNCPLYLCRRCNNGAWGGEYSCQLR